MEAIVELLGMIIMSIFEVIILLLQIILAIFMPSKRSSLKEKWSSSRLLRVEIFVSAFFLVIIIGAILHVTLKIKGCTPETTPVDPQPAEQNTSIKIESPEQIKDKMKEKALDFLKEKWKNRE